MKLNFNSKCLTTLAAISGIPILADIVTIDAMPILFWSSFAVTMALFLVAMFLWATEAKGGFMKFVKER